MQHHRIVVRLTGRYWIVLDTVSAAANHRVVMTFQAADVAQVERETSHRFVVECWSTGLRVLFDPRVSTDIEARTVSPAYGLERPATAMTGTIDIQRTETLCTVLGATDEVALLQLLHDVAESVWRIRHSDGEDLIARPDGRMVTLGPARFDGAVFALVYRDAGAMLVAAGGGTLHFDGRAFPLGANDLRVAHQAPDGTWTMEP